MSSPPIRCMECGKVVGNKWELFWELTGVKPKDKNAKRQMSDDNALDEMKIHRPCCRSLIKTWLSY